MTIEAAPVQKAKFYSLTLEALAEYLKGNGKEGYRAQQLYRWVYERGVTDPEQMTNLAKDFRRQITELFDFSLPNVASTLRSRDGTIKLLIDVGDGMTVEAVLIPDKDRLTLCVSSEVGCNLGCKFCFTGKRKLRKRLSADQIVGQLLRAKEALGSEQEVTNIVFMGMGEPLDNPEAVFNAIKIWRSEFGLGLSRRKITVSTSGLVPLIPEITKSGARLAVSLNGSNNVVRSQVMPINQRYPIEELMAACREYTQATGDRVTFEYVLLKGVTDAIEQARELVQITKTVPCKINLIPFNEHPDSGFDRPDQETVTRFKNELNRLGAHVLVRKTKGRDIYAACGQLTSKFEEKPERMQAEELSVADYSYA